MIVAALQMVSSGVVADNLAQVRVLLEQAAAQGGTHPSGRRTWGTVLAQQAQEPGVVMAELDAAQLAQCRSHLPALQHRLL